MAKVEKLGCQQNAAQNLSEADVSKPQEPQKPIQMTSKKIEFIPNAGIKASIMKHEQSGETMHVAGANVGASLMYHPTDSTSVKAGVDATVGYGGEIGAILGFEKQLDKFTVGAEGYIEKIQSGTPGRMYVSAYDSKSSPDGIVSANTYAEVSAKYPVAQTKAGFELTGGYAPNDKLSFNAGIGAEYVKSNDVNINLHASEKVRLEMYTPQTSYNLESEASAEAHKNFGGAKWQPEAHLGARYKLGKKAYIGAEVSGDPFNLKNTSGAEIKFGINIGKSKKK